MPSLPGFPVFSHRHSPVAGVFATSKICFMYKGAVYMADGETDSIAPKEGLALNPAKPHRASNRPAPGGGPAASAACPRSGEAGRMTLARCCSLTARQVAGRTPAATARGASAGGLHGECRRGTPVQGRGRAARRSLPGRRASPTGAPSSWSLRRDGGTKGRGEWGARRRPLARCWLVAGVARCCLHRCGATARSRVCMQCGCEVVS